MDKEKLREKIYSMSNSYLPLDKFFNDIELLSIPGFDNKSAFNDLETIADFIIDLQNKLFDFKKYCKKLFVELQIYISDNVCGAEQEVFGELVKCLIDLKIMSLEEFK